MRWIFVFFSGLSAINWLSNHRRRVEDRTVSEISKPNLCLIDENSYIFDTVLKRLSKRATGHKIAARWILSSILLTCMGLILLFGYSSDIFRDAVSTSRLNRPLADSFQRQKDALEARKSKLETRTKEIKSSFDEAFRVEAFWIKAGEGEAAAAMTWGDLKGMIGLAVGDKHFGYSADGGFTWKTGLIGELFQAHGTGVLIGNDTQAIGWIAGYHGKIARSTTSIDTWQITSIVDERGEVVDTDTWSLRFDNEKVGWASGSKGVISRTTDGGVSWTEIFRAAKGGEFFQIRSEKNVVGAVGSGGAVALSFDRGLTWSDQRANLLSSVPEISPENVDFRAFDLSVKTPSSRAKVVLVGKGGLIMTGISEGDATGAIRWRVVHPFRPEAGTLRWIERFGSSDNLVALGDNDLFVSRDNGNTWQACPGKRPGLLTAQITGPNTAILAGRNHFIGNLNLPTVNQISEKDIQAEETTAGNEALYQFSRQGVNQIVVGNDILRRVIVPVTYRGLISLDDEAFRHSLSRMPLKRIATLDLPH